MTRRAEQRRRLRSPRRRDAGLSFNQNFTVSRRDITPAVKPPSYKRECELSLSTRPRAYATENEGVHPDKLAALNLMSFIPAAAATAAAMSMQVRACVNTRVKHSFREGESQGRSYVLRRPCPCSTDPRERKKFAFADKVYGLFWRNFALTSKFQTRIKPRMRTHCPIYRAVIIARYKNETELNLFPLQK